MSALLLTLPLGVGAGSGADRAGRQAVATAWWVEPMRWINERLDTVRSGDPAIDVVPRGRMPETGADRWCKIVRGGVTPRVRAQADGASDQAQVRMTIVCQAGQRLLRADDMASLQIAGAVWSVLNEFNRTEIVAVGPGESRRVSLRLGRAEVVDEYDDGESGLVGMVAVVIEQGMAISGPAR